VPRSHTCPSCTQELARIRAVPDQYYGLPVVVCPGCSTASVRTKHPDQQFWRDFRSLVRSLRLIFIRLLLTFVLSILMGLCVATVINMLEKNPLSTNGIIRMPSMIASDPYGISTAGVLVILCVCAVRLSLHHLHAWAAMAVLWGAVGGWVLVFAGPDLFKLVLNLVSDFDIPTNTLSRHDVMTTLSAIALMFAIGTLGLIPGAHFHTMVSQSDRRRSYKTRRRLRRRRTREN